MFNPMEKLLKNALDFLCGSPALEGHHHRVFSPKHTQGIYSGKGTGRTRKFFATERIFFEFNIFSNTQNHNVQSTQTNMQVLLYRAYNFNRYSP